MSKRKYTLSEASETLSYVSPNSERDEWIRVGMALKSEFGDDAWELFDMWSANGDSYHAQACRMDWQRWNDFGGVGFGTLIYIAKQNGYVPNSANQVVEFTDEDKEVREVKRKAAEEQEKQIRGEAAALANQIWNDATPCQNHPYLAKKLAVGYGLKIGQFPYGDSVINALLIPLFNRFGKIRTLQAITSDGKKLLLKNGEKKGCFYIINAADNSANDTIYLCEGYATGDSIHQATGCMVYVGFDAGNLKNVAKTVRSDFPNRKIVIAADNDKYGSDDAKNTGIEAAKTAAQEINGHVVYPEFQDESTKPTDFNDLHALEGLQSVLGRLNPQSVATTEQPFFVDYLTPLVDLTKSGKPRCTIENLEEILQRIGGKIKYNVMRKREEIELRNEAFLVDNELNAALAKLESECAKFDFPTGKINGQITYISDQNAYNPVKDWILERRWDGVSRLQEFYDTVRVKKPIYMPVSEEYLHHVLIRTWMISAINAACNDDPTSSRGVLVFQGGQEIGKTKWFKTLVPKHLKVTQDGVTIDPKDKDSVYQTVANWLVELGELDATFRGADISILKSFITKEFDILRRPFARTESQFPRRTVFFGSVNPSVFLHDSTGNSRYWTVAVESLDFNHAIDMQQVWAEVYEMWKIGASHFLDAETRAYMNASNEDFESVDPIKEIILGKLDWSANQDAWTWKTATEIAHSIGLTGNKRAEITGVSAKMFELNGEKKRKSNGKLQLLCPPLTPVQFTGFN